MILDAVTRWDKEGSDCAPVASSPSPAAESAVLSDEVNGERFFFVEVTIKKIKG